MSPPESVAFHRNALFRGLAPEHLSTLDIELEPVTFAPGEMIFEEGSPGDSCYLLESGRVRISKATPGGEQETLGFITPGEFFGELALFYSAPRSARATAAAPTRAGKLYRENFERLRQIAPLELTTAIAAAGVQHLRDLQSSLIRHVGDADRFRDIGVGLSMIAHDIRSPLATIKSAAELISELIASGVHTSEMILKYAAIIERTANGALASADDLLAEIRGEAPPAEPVVASVQEIVQETFDQVVGLLQNRNVEFTSVVEYRGTIACHRSELVAAIANLVRNALEALPADGGNVELRVHREEDTVVIAVSDTGCGIPEELQGWIFERRFTYGKSGGTGLGLEQVRRVIERHGGRIELESEVGSGTTFWIRLPARSAAAVVP